jgi:hypothetical protein
MTIFLRVISAAIAGVFFYGLAQTQPWAHPAWTHDSWERFLLAMCAVAISTLSLNRWWFYAIILVLACSVGVVPVLGLGFVMLGALNIGWLLFHQEDDRLNLLAGFALLVFAFSLVASVPINTVWLWAPLLAAPIAFGRRFELPLPKPSVAVAMPLVANFLLVLKPEVSSDGLSQHFAIAQWVRDHGRFHFDAANQIWSVQPMAGDWALTLANLFGGEYAARMLNFVWLLVIVSFVYRALRRRLDHTPAALITGIFAATPLLQLTSTSMFIENFWAAMILGALFAIEQGEFILAATFAGASGASKLLGLTPIPGLAAYSFWKLKSAGFWRWRTVFAAVTIFIAIAIVPYARAYLVTLNPVFHYANAFFKSPLLRSDQSFVDLRYPPRLHWRTLYDITFQTDLFVESEPGTAGYQWLWFLPLAAFSLRRANATERAAFATAVLMVILVFSRQASLRYVECAMPLLAIGFAPAAAAINEDRWLRWPACGIGVMLFALNLFQMPGSSGYHRDFCLIPFSAQERKQYITEMAPERLLIAEMNRIAPAAPVADLAGDDIAGLRGPAWTATWHTRKFSDPLAAARSIADYVNLMHRFQVEYMIAPREGHWLFIKDSPLDVFIQTSTDPMMSAGSLQLVKLRADVNPVEPPPAEAGTYDDSNRRIIYEGAWFLDQSFPQAARGTVSYSSDPAANLRFRFNGNRIDYYFTKAFNRGKVSVEIDGISKGTIDLYSKEAVWQARATFDRLGTGLHTIVIRHAGPNGSYIDIDQFIVE